MSKNTCTIKTKKTILCTIYALTLFLLSICTAGCSSGDMNTPYSKTSFLLNTFVTISIYPEDKSSINYTEILDAEIDTIRSYENLFSKTLPGSDIYRINNANGKPVNVSAETIELIKLGIYYGDISNGVFDITIAPVSDLWNFQSEDPTIPASNEIAEALSHVDYHNILIDYDNGTVQLLDPKSAIDLGGIAKGYIADKIKESLVDKGIKSAIINLGGNVLTIGQKPSKNIFSTKYSPFEIAVQKPFSSQNDIYTVVDINDSSVVTSGSYERYFIKDDVLYHHILDTNTGYPVETDLSGITVLSPKSVDGDALSTICFCLGKEKAREFINSLADNNISVIPICK